MLKMNLKVAAQTALMGANMHGNEDGEYPGTRYIIDCGGNNEERFIVKMNPFVLEKGQKIISVIKYGDKTI